jgi:CubicO group peptidase (beta-lactamase class C family)
MVKRGEVNLDDPVRSFLPASVKFPVRAGREITLVDLATHRSGLPRMPANFNPKDPENPYADYSVEQMYAFLSSHELTRGVGDMYEYSNLAVGLLGHVLALRAGKSYEALLTERILQPLGMHDTRITFTPSMRERLARGHFSTGFPAGNWDIPTLAGAGAIRSTVNDMLKFVAANLDPRPDGLPAALRSAHTVQREGPGSSPPVGLNWHLNRRRGREFVWHNGQTGGYHGYLALDPANRTGVVVLSNTSFTVDGIGLWVLDTTTTLSRLAPIPVRKEVVLPGAALDEFVGEYRMSPTFAITVIREGTVLYMQATGQGRLRALPESDLKFFLREVDAQISFVRDASGKVNELVLHQGGADQRASRVR